MNFRDLIPTIAEGIDIKPGSLILLHLFGENEDIDLLDKFSLELSKKGILTIKWQYSQDFLKDYYSVASEDALTYPDKFFEIFDKVDGVIDICTYTPPQFHVDFPREKLPFYGGYMGNLMRRLGEKETFIQIKVPSEKNYVSSGLSYDNFTDELLNAYNVNYSEMKNVCLSTIDNLKDKTNVKIISENNSELTFSLENRTWYSDHGNGDFPCGEVYIAPIEESCNGSVVIPTVIFEGESYNNVEMSFENGKLISCSEEDILEYVKGAPGDSDIIGEFGIGLNPNVKNLIGYVPIDEKAIGTVHIALGMNDMFGGNNSSPLHMDFVFTPKAVEFDNVDFNLK
ncbi:MAG: aminopeptidase [Clostridium sp.]